MVDAPAGDAPRRSPLACLGGRPPSDAIAEDLKLLATLPKSARDRFWQALAAVLADPLPPTVEPALGAFCATHGVSRSDLQPPVQAARFLVRAAALMNLNGSEFATDIAAATEGDLDIAATLLAGYDGAKEIIRAEAKRATMRDHGNLYTGLDWRVEVVSSSNRGAALAMPVAVFTLHYLDGKEEKRLTLQMPAQGVLELKQACERVLA